MNLIDFLELADSFEMSSIELSLSESVIFEVSANLTDFSVSVVLVDCFVMSSIELSLSESVIFEASANLTDFFELSANLTDFFELRTDSDFEQVGALASKCEVEPEMKLLNNFIVRLSEVWLG